MSKRITPTGFWTYQAANETPTLAQAIAAGAIAADTTADDWANLTPGMRREIVRTPYKALAVPGTCTTRRHGPSNRIYERGDR